MNSSMDTFVMQDFGAGQHGQFTGADAHAGRVVNRRIGDLSTEGSVDPFWAAVLFFLIRGLRPQRCLEMGGLVGISTAYQSAALHLNAVDGAGAVSLPLQPMSESSRFRQRGDPCRIVVLEGDPTLAGIVQSNLEALSLSGQACIVVGRFAETLPEVMNVHGPFEFAFVDGHHDGEATVTYFDQIRPHLSPGSIVVFDDIAWSAGMRMAWEVVSSRPGVALAVSANQFGILRISESKAAPDPGTSRDVEAGEVDRYKLWLV
jgi:predicted O-methyltransferase YrrM